MSENTRKRKLENGDDNIDDEGIVQRDEENIQEESQNDSNNNDEDRKSDDEDELSEINHGDDYEYSTNSNPWEYSCNNPYSYDDYDDDDDDDCQLQRAIKYRKPMNDIMELIKLFPMQVKHKNSEGCYPLHTALEYDITECITMKLIEIFPEAAKHKNSSGLYPLHMAFRYNQSEDVVMKLIEVFPKPMFKSSKNGNVLHLACRNDLSETFIKKLIEINPLAVQEKKSDGIYPIHSAIYHKQAIAVIKIFLDADPLGMQRRAEFAVNDDETTFHCACQKTRDLDLIEYLMKRSDLQINVRNSRGKTPLHDVCCYCYLPNEDRVRIFDMLLHHPDVDVNATDSLNDTPLHTTLKICDKYQNPERLLYIVQQLLNDPLILINGKNNDGKTPLDLIKDHIYVLKNQDEARSIKKDKLKYFMKIINLLEEFAVKRRWQGYLYHVKIFNAFKGL